MVYLKAFYFSSNIHVSICCLSLLPILFFRCTLSILSLFPFILLYIFLSITYVFTSFIFPVIIMCQFFFCLYSICCSRVFVYTMHKKQTKNLKATEMNFFGSEVRKLQDTIKLETTELDGCNKQSNEWWVKVGERSIRQLKNISTDQY